MGSLSDLELAPSHHEGLAHASLEKLSAPGFTRDEDMEKRLRRKYDKWILPMGLGIYLLCFIDRTNMGNARIMGLTEDTNLIGNRYNITLTVFYVGYILFEIPSNMLCKHVGPRIWLSFLTAGFGLTTFAIAFINSFKLLVFLRLVLGIFEAGILPGIMLSFSQFYRRHELVGRWGVMCSGASFAGSFGGLLSAGFGSIPRLGMMFRWRWIFLLEGIITFLFAILVLLVLPKSISEAHFLTDDEKIYAANRVNEEMMMKKPEHLNWKVFKKALLNTNTHLSSLALLCSLCTMTSLSFFMPTVLRTMGFTSIISQLLTVPPYFVATIVCASAAIISDRIRNRGKVLMFIAPLIPIGFALLATINITGVKYFAIFFSTTGAFTMSPILVSWGSENSAGPAVRAITSAYLVGFGSIGALISTWTYLAKDAPRYVMGHWINFGFGVLACIVIPTLVLVLTRENGARERGERDHLLELPEDEIDQLGYLHPRFKFTT